MIGNKMRVACIAFLSIFLLTGFGLKDLKKELGPDTDKCEGRADQKKCERKEKLKSGAKIIAVGIAAKLIYDMVVEYTSVGVKGDHEVIEIYLKENKSLPKNPKVIAYEANLAPSKVVKVGKPVTIKSAVSVVPSKSSSTVKIEEQIEIFDNEDSSKTIKSLTKTVNGESKKGGAFENQFNFTLPKGMPQGVYPIKTAILVDGKRHESANNDMQVVLLVTPNNEYQIAMR